MSGALQLDMEPSLDDLLDFIDTFDESSSSGECSTTTRQLPGDEGVDCARRAAAIRDWKIRHAAATRRFQHKKRTELLALRVQVEALEKRLAELSRSRRERTHGAIDQAEELSAVAEQPEHLVKERRRRKEAETRNRKLKSVLAQQRQEAKAIRRLLGDVAFWQSDHAVKRPLGPRNADLVEVHDALVDDLAASMGQMLLDSSTVFKGMDASRRSLVPVTPTVQRDAVTGLPFVDLRVSITFDTNTADAMKWLFDAKLGSTYTYFSVNTTKDGIRKDATLTLGGGTPVDIISLAQTREDKERMLCTWSSRLTFDASDDKLRFSEQGWFLAKPTSTGAVLHACYRLAPDVASSMAQKSEDAEARVVAVLQARGASVYKNFAAIQGLNSARAPS